MAHVHDHEHRAGPTGSAAGHDADPVHTHTAHAYETAAGVPGGQHGHAHATAAHSDLYETAHGLHSGHSHGVGHVHGPANYDRAFAIGVALNVGFVAVEATFGWLSNSLALVADAGHNLSDVLALLLAWGAAILCRRLPTARRTYGWRRSSILAALVNAITLFVVVGAVSWEAIHRLMAPSPVAGGIMILVAALGVVVNGAAALLFLGGRQHDANIRGAFLHLAADAAVSLGVVIAGLAILATGWLWLDPAVSLGISVVIVLGTWGLLRDALNMALDAVPSGIDERRVRAYLEGLPEVREVHDLHIWAMSTTETALTAHLVLHELPHGDTLLAQVTAELQERFDIEHSTLQLEHGDVDHPCVLAPAHMV